MIEHQGNDKFFGMYRGEVLFVDDPKKQGRIKVAVLPMFRDLAHEVLPWAVPAFSLWNGAGKDGTGFFAVPREGTFVYVMFEEGDPDQPIYVAEAPTGVHGQMEAKDTHYPRRKVLRTKSGIQFIVDDEEGEEMVQMEHPTGTTYTVDKDGNIIITGVKDQTVSITDDVKATVGKNIFANVGQNITGTVGGNIILQAGGTIMIQGQGTSTMTTTGTLNIKADGPVNVESLSTVTVKGAAVEIN